MGYFCAMPRRAMMTSFAILLGGCLYGSRPPLTLPDHPRPFTALSSPYDDFNAAAPDTAGGRLVFSTNRGSRGAHFDLWIADLHFEESRAEVRRLAPYEPALMSPGQELGPQFFEEPREPEPGSARREWLVFASDRQGGAGGLDLFQVPVHFGAATSGPAPVATLNTPSDEAYWTTDDRGREAHFASNRDGQGMDAYRVVPPLGGEGARIERVAELSSPADDTAFFQFTRDGDELATYLLFASNREGGRGDYDLYCARKPPGGAWEAPRPLTRANTAAREFRPIIITGFHRDVLLFSSNRPGGQGGMDFYYMDADIPCAPRR